MILRDYQREAVSAVQSAWSGERAQRLVVQLPTGSGKTVVFAALCADEIADGGRVLVLTNRDELVGQSTEKLQRAAPAERIGVVQGGRDEWRRRIVVASVQTLSRANRLARVPRERFTMIVCDEMQYSAAPSWVRILEHFNSIGAGTTKRVGFSATPNRSDRLGLGDLWDRVVFERDVAWAIEHGHLVRPEGRRTTLADFDLTGARTSGGDYVDSEIAERMHAAHAAEAVAAAYATHALDDHGQPRRGILFAPTVASAHEFADALNAVGVRTEVVVGSTPIEARQAAYARVRSGTTRVLASVMVLAVGFDLPAVEVAVMCRPTKHKSLYVQQAGRVLRPCAETGKTSALILDVCGVSVLGLATFADLKTTRPKQDAPNMTPGERAPVDPKEIVTGLVDLRPIDPITGRRIGATALSRLGHRDWLWTWDGMPFLPAVGRGRPTLFASRTITPDGDLWVGWSQRNAKSQRVAICYGSLELVRKTLEPLHKLAPSSWASEVVNQWQIDDAKALGLTLERGCTRRQAADAIWRHKVSQVLDFTVPHTALDAA